MRNLHLGLDSSTQSLSVAIIDLTSREIVYSHSLNFDAALPRYGTKDGVLRTSDPTVIHAPPLMWAEALDILFMKMKIDGVPLGKIKSISGSGQQHGSVYLNKTAETALANLDANLSLVENLQGIFSRPASPVWMDSSTSQACREITGAMESHGGIIQATGSAAIERFTGPQIRAFWQQHPEAYEATRHIALVSSFMCSVISGKIAPIDPGDGAGMNLMDIRRFTWHSAALSATAPDLIKKLPSLAPSGSIIGTVSPYFAKRYGLAGDAVSVIWSGDNPCSVIGLGLIQPGMVAISMGTSYTYFGTMNECQVDPDGYGHVFGSPAGGYMTLNCFKNGGLARARIRHQFGLDWAGYRAAMAQTPPGNHGRLMLPWFDPEIVPKVLNPRVRRLNLDEDDAAGNCRALVEAQMMSMRLHSEWMKIKPTNIYATGGASEDPAVLQVIADIFQCPVQRSENTNSAALGAALIAAHSFSPDENWKETIQGFSGPAKGPTVLPDIDTAPAYSELIKRYAQLEISSKSV
jgi:xylulokinase